jgi:hypothetical protein
VNCSLSRVLDERAKPCIGRDECFHLTIVLNSAFSSSDIRVLLWRSYSSAMAVAEEEAAEEEAVVEA